MEDSTDSIKPMKLIRCCEDSGFHGGIVPSSRPFSFLYGDRVGARKTKPDSCTIRLKKKQDPPQESEGSTDSLPFRSRVSISRKTAMDDETGSSSSCSGIYCKRKLVKVYDFVDVMDDNCFKSDNYSRRKIWNGAHWCDEFWGDENSVSNGFLATEECDGSTTVDASPESCLKIRDWDMKEVKSESDTGRTFSRFLITKKFVFDDFSAPNVAKVARFKSCSCGPEEET